MNSSNLTSSTMEITNGMTITENWLDAGIANTVMRFLTLTMFCLISASCITQNAKRMISTALTVSGRLVNRMELIDKDTLLRMLRKTKLCGMRANVSAECVADAMLDVVADFTPAIDAVQVVHGVWQHRTWNSKVVICSNCGYVHSEEMHGRRTWHYCDDCGAKMDEER